MNRCLLSFAFLANICLLAADKTPEPAKWDVDNPPGPKTTASISTSTGTWMNLDLSPDGQTIVFDLLGDLYTIPISGGEAKAITSGIAWDMQPRFSPDGKRIAFTSDRGGGDNIWTVSRDGSDAQQLTKETFRLLSNPAWTPDGQYVVARKHFTGSRSLGSGEMWLYHRSGGEGLQLTKRPNDQKDVDDPAFSPNGRYLYFDQDITPGSTFAYNKDPNTVLYATRRLDRTTGKILDLLTEPGGSVRPTPSPDGKQLAFVRRVRSKTALYLLDLESGIEHKIYDNLDRDMQETWSIHGLYPSMAWTRDSKSLIFWAAGGIQRIDVAAKVATPIPFHVQSTRQVTEAVRFPVDVAPDRFNVKLLRDVTVSPKRDMVIYQALGHLYTRDLPNGSAKRLTNDNDVWESQPAFSRDGSQLVYAVWNDEKFGELRLRNVATGETRKITTEPGYYFEPSFAPDASTIVYRKGKGGGILSPAWSHDTGLYAIPLAGGAAKLISTSGTKPHFGNATDRVFFLDRSGSSTSLKSILLTGADVRTHLKSADALAMRVSPDQKWVAFTELFNTYIAPFPATGQAIEISPKSKAMPVHQVTRDAGENVEWTQDSRSLYWSLGPELFERDLKDSFAFEPGAPSKLPPPAEHGLNISFQQPYAKPSGKIALVGARIVTMKGDQVIERGTIIVDGNRIAEVGPQRSVRVPAGAKVIQLQGATVIPGLVDVHAHGPYGQGGLIPQQNWAHYAQIAFGVTTTHDPSSDTDTVFSASELAKANAIVAPRIFSTGTILYGAKLPIRAEIDSLDDARSHLRRLQAAGAFSVKSYNQPRRDQRQQIIAAARELGMMVVPEGGSLYNMNMSMVVDGHTGIEHAIPVARMYDDVLQLWPQTKVGYTPTIIVGYGGNWGENYWYQHTNVWDDERLLRYVPRAVVDPRSRRRTMVPDDENNHIAIARMCKALLDRGVRINMGAHGQMQGIGPHWEMWMFVQGGMTPLEAMRSATLSGAQYVGLDRDIGSLEKGKLADLAILSDNPLLDIHNTEHVRYTMVNGRLFETDTMNEVGNETRQRKKFYFETQDGAASAGSDDSDDAAGDFDDDAGTN